MEEKTIVFLESIIHKIKTGDITPEQMRQIAEFYLAYEFKKDSDSAFSNKDMLNFLSLGWYIYSNLENEII